MRRDPAMKRHNNSAKEACDYKESWHTHVRKHTDALPVYRSPLVLAQSVCQSDRGAFE